MISIDEFMALFAMLMFCVPLIFSNALISRKRYLKTNKTLAFDANASDSIVYSGRSNQLNFSLRGTVTRSGTGAVTGKDAPNAMANFKIESDIYGTVFNGDGNEVYQTSRVMYNSAAFTTCGTGTSVTSVGFEFTLPIACQSGETLTITPTWGALTAMGTLITAYTGVLRMDAEILPVGVQPEAHFAMRHHNIGASGVIGANASYDLAPINTIDKFQLCGFVIEINTSAIGTYTSGLSSITLTNGAGNYIIDENADVLRHIFGLEILTALPTGVYYFTFAPFTHTAETVLTLTNGATATVAGTQAVALYACIHTLSKAYGPSGTTNEVQPQRPPPVPTVEGGAGTLSGSGRPTGANISTVGSIQIQEYLKVPQR